MGIFYSSGEDRPEPDQRPPEIPERARERLSGLSGGGVPFTSTLSVNEFVAIDRHQFAPVCQVMGSSVYHIGWQAVGWGTLLAPGSLSGAPRSTYVPWDTRLSWYGMPQELRTISAAYNEARERALARLSQETELTGADAVVGLRVTQDLLGITDHLIEFRAHGTAVRAPSMRTQLGPAVTNLSGQDVSLLLEAGHRPLGLVAATSVYYGSASIDTVNELRIFRGKRWKNFEYAEFADAWAYARNRALMHMRAQAGDLGASGIIGVTWSQETREHEVEDSNLHIPGVIYAVHAIGTAISGPVTDGTADVYTVMSMADPLTPEELP
jgi:uncharacterized protein YbjQ (UPF0145 family)